MSNQKKSLSADLGKECFKLRLAAQQVRAIGHLLKWQQNGVIPDEEVLSGIGEVLEGIGRQIVQGVDVLEDSPYAVAWASCRSREIIKKVEY